jgi:type I restriction enzyme S subunit
MAKQDYIFVICPSVRERAPRFRYSKFKDVLLPVPPAGEQRRIMDASLKSASAAQEAAATLGRQVERLQEYRQALITAAVTGQLDISEEIAS